MMLAKTKTKENAKKLNKRKVKSIKANEKQPKNTKTLEGKKKPIQSIIKDGMKELQHIVGSDTFYIPEKYEDRLRSDLKPRGALEDLLFEKLIGHGWRLILVQTIERQILGQFTQRTKGDQKNDGHKGKNKEDGRNSFELIQFVNGSTPKLYRYMNSIEKAFSNSLKEFQKAQQDRRDRKNVKKKK